MLSYTFTMDEINTYPQTRIDALLAEQGFDELAETFLTVDYDMGTITFSQETIN